MSGDNPSKEVDPFIGILVYNMQEKKVIPPQKRN